MNLFFRCNMREGGREGEREGERERERDFLGSNKENVTITARVHPQQTLLANTFLPF